MVIFHSYDSWQEGKPPFSYGFPMFFLWLPQQKRRHLWLQPRKQRVQRVQVICQMCSSSLARHINGIILHDIIFYYIYINIMGIYYIILCLYGWELLISYQNLLYHNLFIYIYVYIIFPYLYMDSIHFTMAIWNNIEIGNPWTGFGVLQLGTSINQVIFQARFDYRRVRVRVLTDNWTIWGSGSWVE